jgi:hypothetical protein
MTRQGVNYLKTKRSQIVEGLLALLHLDAGSRYIGLIPTQRR